MISFSVSRVSVTVASASSACAARRVVQHAVLQLDQVLAAGVAEVEVERRPVASRGLRRVQADAEIVEEQVERHRPDGVGAGRVRRRQLAPRPCAAPWHRSGRSCATAPTRPGSRAAPARRPADPWPPGCPGSAKTTWFTTCGHPAVVALVVGLLRLLQNGVGAAHELDVVLAGLDRRQLVQRRRIAVEPAEIEDVGGRHVVVDRAVVAAVRPERRRGCRAARTARRSRASSCPGWPCAGSRR